MDEIRRISTLAEWGDYVDTHDLSAVWDLLPEPFPEPFDKTICPVCGVYVVAEFHAEQHLGREEL